MAKIVRFRETESNRFLYTNFIGQNLKVTREMGGNCCCGVVKGLSRVHFIGSHLHWCNMASIDVEIPMTRQIIRRVNDEEVEVVE